GGEVNAEEIRRIFNYEYLPSDDADKAWGRFQIVGLRTDSGSAEGRPSERVEVDLIVDGQERSYEGHGNGPIDALVKILIENFDVDVRLQDYTEHAIGSGADTTAAAYVELAVEDRVVWGAGLHPNITKASLKAVVSAVNRAARDREAQRQAVGSAGFVSGRPHSSLTRGGDDSPPHVSDNGRVHNYRDEGIVLSGHKLGEADRIVSVLTRSHGLIRAVAKGVRRTKSRFASRLEPFMLVDLQCHVGRSLDIVTQVELIEPFARGIATDYDVYSAASVMAETASRITEAEPV